jgi:polyhydroxyalkanoate synthesis regulator phasin
MDADIKPQNNKPKARKIYSYGKVNWDNIKDKATKLADRIVMTIDQGKHTVDDLWCMFREGLLKIQEEQVPSTMRTSRYNLPWFNNKLKRLVRKKHRLYAKAKKHPHQPENWQKYKNIKKEVQNAIRAAHWDHVNKTWRKHWQKKTPNHSGVT